MHFVCVYMHSSITCKHNDYLSINVAHSITYVHAAGSDLTSLSFPLSFPPSTDGGGFGKVCKVLKLFPLFLK